MKTSKPFSTISYNSDDFLSTKLDDLIRSRKLEFYAFVNHHKEEDEAKDHKHLYIVPNGQINTDQVLDLLLEHDPTHPDKPLACIQVRSSKFADWYLYSIHDTDYLASKGQSRKYHYTREDLKCSDPDYLLEEIHSMDLSKLNRTKALKDAATTGRSFYDLLLNGQIPVQQVYAYEHAFELLNRAGRSTHTPYYDPETGEVIKAPKVQSEPLPEDTPDPFN